MGRKMAAYQKIKSNFQFLDFLEKEYAGEDELSERSIHLDEDEYDIFYDSKRRKIPIVEE